MVERLAEPNDGAIELPVALAETAHLIDQRILEPGRIVIRLEQRIRERLDRFRLWSALGRGGLSAKIVITNPPRLSGRRCGACQLPLIWFSRSAYLFRRAGVFRNGWRT